MAVNAIGIDIGTTTCAMVLFDLIVGAEVEQRSFVNPQVGFGSDVIRRIHFANNVQNIGTLQKLITTAIDQEIHSLLSVNHIDPQDLIDVVIAGNTTMNYLLLGYNPSSLAVDYVYDQVKTSLLSQKSSKIAIEAMFS